MDRRERRGWIIFATALGLLVTLIVVVAARPVRGTVQGMGVDQNIGKVLPLALKFKDEKGQDVLLGDYFHKKRPVVVVPLFYRCQSACALLTDGVLETMVKMKLADAGRDYEVVFFTILPKETHEDAVVRKKYILERYNTARKHPTASEGIHCLTGSEDSINQLCKTLGYTYKWNPKTDEVTHPTAIMIATPEGMLSKYFYGVDFVPNLVLKSMETARKETIAEKSEPKFFGCWSMDPSRGVYVLRAGQFLKIFGTAFALALLGSIAYMAIRFKPAMPDNPSDGGSASEK